MEHESHHHHPHHGTGMRWLDITLGVSATIVSLVSLWLGLHSAHSMEKLVAANSFPYLELMQSMSGQVPLPGDERVRDVVEYELVNNGVGPARVEWVEMRFKGKPVADITALLDACCKADKYNYDGLNRRGNITGAFVRAGGSLKLFTWSEQNTANADFKALHRGMKDIEWSACYCSVFDECYQRSTESNKSEAVKQCTAPKVAFRPRQKGDK
ncbi:MAG: hypothetical protein WCC39_09685 [Telluria sp.]